VFNATFNNVSVILWWSDLLVVDTTLCDEVCQCFSPFSSNNTTDHHDITEILLTVVLNTKTLTLWWSDLLVEDPGENHRPVANH
jgi:hypothetical protein